MGLRLLKSYFYLVEVKNKVQFAYIVEVFIEHLHKVVDRLQIAQVVVVYVHADAEVQPRIPPVHNFEISELEMKNFGRWKTSKIMFKNTFLNNRTSTKLVCFASRTVTTAWTSSISFCFSSSSKFMYHFANRVLPARFWIRMKRIYKIMPHENNCRTVMEIITSILQARL